MDCCLKGCSKYFCRLPDDVLSLIARELTKEERVGVRLVNRQARRVIDNQLKSARFTGHGLQDLISACPSLHTKFPNVAALQLTNDKHSGRVTDFLIEAWLSTGANAAAFLSKVNTLDVSNTDLLARGMRLLLKAMPNLQVLIATRWSEAASLMDLPALSKLHTLVLGDTQMDNLSLNDKGLQVIAQCSNLSRLSLQKCVGVTDTGLTYLAALPKLSELCLADTRVTGSALSTLVHLTSLDATRCFGIGDAQLHAAAGSLKQLKQLWLVCTGCTNFGLVALQQMSNLTTLFLGPGFEMSDEGLQALARCPKLQELSFGNFNITQPPPKDGFQSLTLLQFGGTYFNRGVRHAFPLGQVTHVIASGHTAVVDAHVSHLVQQHSLKNLQLQSGYQLTPNGLQVLQKLPGLQQLTLVACPLLTADSVHQLLGASSSLKQVLVRKASWELPQEVCRQQDRQTQTDGMGMDETQATLPIELSAEA